LLREQCEQAELAVVGFCLMSNHISLVVAPAHEAAMAERFSGRQWRELLVAAGAREEARRLERCTFAGKPYGEESFVEELSERFGRCLALRGPGRPPQTKHAGAGK